MLRPKGAKLENIFEKQEVNAETFKESPADKVEAPL